MYICGENRHDFFVFDAKEVCVEKKEKNMNLEVPVTDASKSLRTASHCGTVPNSKLMRPSCHLPRGSATPTPAPRSRLRPCRCRAAQNGIRRTQSLPEPLVVVGVAAVAGFARSPPPPDQQRSRPGSHAGPGSPPSLPYAPMPPLCWSCRPPRSRVTDPCLRCMRSSPTRAGTSPATVGRR